MTYVDGCDQCERISDAYSEYCDRTAELLRDVETERDHFKKALERIVFVHSDAMGNVPADALAEIAGEALDSAPSRNSQAPEFAESLREPTQDTEGPE